MRELSQAQRLALTLPDDLRRAFWLNLYWLGFKTREAYNKAIEDKADNTSPLERWR